MNCDSARTIHTVGHSTRTIETFHALLQAHEIELLVDVRRWPASRRHPQFHRKDWPARNEPRSCAPKPCPGAATASCSRMRFSSEAGPWRISWTTAATATSYRRSLIRKTRKSITVGCSRVIIKSAFRGLLTFPRPAVKTHAVFFGGVTLVKTRIGKIIMSRPANCRRCCKVNGV